ncbi:HalX domain-containing protein [Haladaptatus sp. CMSO5]|uniref:HalX domain-containing protein n=1 Tax=Haladaptatus sp. CMSO5 TaxID=3120514 RepID=UPI002FCE503A
MSTQETVLIVDDERSIVDAFAQWLSETYTVRPTYSGKEALGQLDESVDIVLLDRRMPNMDGEAVLETIADRDLDCRVVMITGVEPDFDILDLGFDAYLRKPVSSPEKLLDTVQALSRRATYDQQMQEFLALASKKATLEATKPPEELEASEEYAGLEAELLQLRNELSDTATTLDDQDLRATFKPRR